MVVKSVVKEVCTVTARIMRSGLVVKDMAFVAFEGIMSREEY